jgi:RNA polymerase sigma factor (sigma-70 family)
VPLHHRIYEAVTNGFTDKVSTKQDQLFVESFNELPSLWQQVLLLRYQQQQPIQEIAKLLHYSPSTIGVYHRKAMHRLRKALIPSYQALLK